VGLPALHGRCVPGLAGDYRSDLDRLLGALTLDGPRVVAHKPAVIAFSDRDRRVPSDKLRHLHPYRFYRRGDHAAGCVVGGMAW
jgi:hypothetical protein